MPQSWRTLGIAAACAAFAAVASRAADGDLDPTFGSHGKVVTIAGPDVLALWPAIAIQADGRIVVVASQTFATTTPIGRFGLMMARYEPNGALDPTFGSGGLVLQALGEFNTIASVAVQSDGKIVLAGSIREDVGGDLDWMLRRYEADGSVDAAFGIGGVVVTALSARDDDPSRMIIQPDGRIVVAGTSLVNLAIARYDTDGTPDPTFGVGGALITDIAVQYGTTLLLQPDGRLIVGGGAAPAILARYQADGSLDPSFGSGGVVVISAATSRVFDAVLQSDGSIVAGVRGAVVYLVRVDATGMLDGNFGDAGRVELPPAVDSAVDMVGDPLGNVLVLGGAGQSAVVVRLDAEGAFDPTLSPCGVAVTAFEGNLPSHMYGLALQPDGRFVVASRVRSADGTQVHVALARFGTPSAPAACSDGATGKSRLVLKPVDRTKWKWVSSAPLTTADFGTPDAGTDVSFCVLDGATGAPHAIFTIPGTTSFCGSTNCWNATSKGYLGQRQAPGYGKLRMKLVAPAGKPGKLVVTGRAFASGEPSFPLPTPLVARMQLGEGGACWEATYSAPIKNAAFDGFLAFSD